MTSEVSGSERRDEVNDLRKQIDDLYATLSAILQGGVDGVIVGAAGHEQLYTLRSADRPYRDIVERMGEGAATVSEGGIILFANSHLSGLVGRSRDYLIGSDVTTLVARRDATTLTRLLMAGPDETFRAELELASRQGTVVPVLVSCTGLDLGGVLIRSLIVTDLTERKAVERRKAEEAARMRQTSARFAAAFDHAPLGMALIDPNLIIVRANSALVAITGWRLDDLVGISLGALTDPRDEEANRLEYATLMSGQTSSYRRELRLVTALGKSRWVAMSVARVGGPRGNYAVTHFEDIDERKAAEGRLQFLADHDPLTGLFNRRRFQEELEHQVALDARHGRTSCVVLIDLDNFKYINDTLGHAVGDRLIGAVADGFRGRLRASDVIGRLGGDEFAVLLPEADERRAVTVTASLLAGIRSSEVRHGGQRVRSTGSAGIALDSVDVRTADDVLANADLAMYAAKAAGRNGYVVHDPNSPYAARARAHFRWLDRIRHALDNQQLVLLAQPILDLHTGTVRGAELLVRLVDEDELVEPDRFLGIAEQHGLASAIDRFVIARGIEVAAEQARGSDFRWEVNISADSLNDPQIPDLIESELQRWRVAPATMVFEITETAAIRSIDQAQVFAQSVTDLGCRFALDDFGAGYGSFYYLKHLPFDYLKIDGEFIRHLSRSRTDQVIVQAIVGASRRLGKETIAEYVGDAATVTLLRGLGVDHAQGFYVGRTGELAAL